MPCADHDSFGIDLQEVSEQDTTHGDDTESTLTGHPKSS